MRIENCNHRRRTGFSLIELVVAIGVICILMGLLLPALSNARQRAVSLQCQSNLRQVGQMLQMYANSNNGWPSPVVLSPQGRPVGRGVLLPPDQRWPVYVFDIPGAAASSDVDINGDAWPYTPAVLRCPSDQDPGEAHSYVLNWDPIAMHGEHGGHMVLERSAELIIMAEKYGARTDYYLEPKKDLSSVIDFYHHGPVLYSNYLYG